MAAETGGTKARGRVSGDGAAAGEMRDAACCLGQTRLEELPTLADQFAPSA